MNSQSRRGWAAASLLALLAACATTPAPPGAPGAPSTAAPAGAPTIASEQRRLADEVRGTPVVVETTPEGRLRVEVPLEFCFDHGRSAVKPPLAAVLDRVAAGLRKQSAFSVRVGAPTDARGAGGEVFARDRAASVRDYLVARGVPPTRFAAIGRADQPGVEVLIADTGAR
ncbi:MAG TPA: OmpA family protein [Ideonella sp.]|nr:OmpA family protein [Ideonella sp.]